MAEVSVRVALLARPGDARDQLRRALADLGAELVAEGDPNDLDPGTVSAAAPKVVLVSLEPAVEDALDRFEQVLGAPDVEVMFDDAEVTRQLDGWDLARWARHLAAKLVGGDVLPPAPADSDALPQMDLAPVPGAPPTPEQVMAGEKLEDYAAESLDLSEWVPTEPSLAAEPLAGAPAEAAPVADEAPLDLDIDLGDLEQALGSIDADVAPPPRPVEPAADEPAGFDPDSLDIDLSALPAEGSPLPTAYEPALDLGDGPLLADVTLTDGPVNFSNFSEDDAAAEAHLDEDVAALAAQLEAFEANDQREMPREPDFTVAFGDEEPVPAASPAPAATNPAPGPAPVRGAGLGGSFGNLELVPMDGDAPPTPVSEPPQVSFRAPNPALERASGFSLADEDAPPRQSVHAGAVLVLAGLGGPDAVRQLLAGLPTTLPVPVLLYQHLDTGKHDRLVGQLAKASRLPVDLAEAGRLAFPGRVAVISPGLGVRVDEGSLGFAAVEGLANLVEALPAADSGVLVLSGADPSLVPAIEALRAAGGLVLVQDPAGCFDPAAAEALARAGAPAATPAELAAQVAARWQ